MLNGYNFVVDVFSDVYQMIKPWITHEFWDLGDHDVLANSLYIIGRKQFWEYPDRVRDLISRSDITVVFDNCAEGSLSLLSQLRALDIDEAARQGDILLIGGGDMESHYRYMRYDHFLCCILDYEENVLAMSRSDAIFETVNKPYDFVFLNGRARAHRKYLFEKFREKKLLDRALWTMLDSRPCVNRLLVLQNGDQNVMATVSPLQCLPKKYEHHRYHNAQISPGPPERTFIKTQLFNNEWGEIYLEPLLYIDSYFSVVTETVFEYPYSFRTEKIAKVLAQGHPWICAANRGFYRDLQSLGFRTFSSLIDERFDSIDDHQERMDAIIRVVQDLCTQDLDSFSRACQETCKYNQQRLIEFRQESRSAFPQQFRDFLLHHERS